MRLGAWRSKQGGLATKRKPKPALDRAAIRAQAIDSLIQSRGMTKIEAEVEYARRNRMPK